MSLRMRIGGEALFTLAFWLSVKLCLRADAPLH